VSRQPIIVAPVPRVALTREEAAASLGVSVDFFDSHIRPQLKLVRRERPYLVRVAELERWARENESGVLD
jgi:hypothetical protein